MTTRRRVGGHGVFQQFLRTPQHLVPMYRSLVSHRCMSTQLFGRSNILGYNNNRIARTMGSRRDFVITDGSKVSE